MDELTAQKRPYRDRLKLAAELLQLKTGNVRFVGFEPRHENPGAKTHGGHAGDMTPLLVNADGTAWASFRTDRFVDAEVFDADGSAVIVHAGADNLANIPTRYRTDAGAGPDAATLATGDAGARVACGLIRRAKS